MITRITLCVLIFSTAMFAENLALTSNAKTDYVIMRPAGSSESQIFAAQELQKYVKEISGCQLEITTDDNPLPAKAILLGNTRYTAKVLGREPDAQKLGTDGFYICIRKPYLLIIGGKERGTLYGVYELLETYMGCRWYSSRFSIIPKQPSIKISLSDNTQIPAFDIREIFYFDLIVNPDFAAKMRSNGHAMNMDAKYGGHIYYANHWLVHTFRRLLPEDKYYASHPEYFMMKNGVRRKGEQLCLSNPEVLEIVIQRVKEILRKDPDARFISVSQPDGASACECPECKALDEREGSPSASIINFVNKVGKAIEKEFPNTLVETLAYQYTRKPPKTLKPRRNVIPRLCSIECEFSKPFTDVGDAENTKFREDMEKWGKISDRLLIWDYVTCFHPYIMPFPNFNALQSNLQFFRNNHVYGVLSQGDYNGQHGEFAELRAWILAKLHWNPDQNVDKLYDDFFAGYYGPAAKYVREYFDGLQKLAKPQANELKFRTKITASWFKRKFFIDAKKLFDKAEESVANDPERLFNVRTTSIPVYYALIELWPEFRARQVWENGRSSMTGVPAGYVKLAEEMFNRIMEAKMYRPGEYMHWSAKFLYDMRKYSKPAEPVMISSTGVKTGVVPSLGAMVSILDFGDGKNYLCPEYGGMDFTLGAKQFEKRWGSLSIMEGDNAFYFAADPKFTNSQSVTCNFYMPDAYDIRRTFKASNGGIDIKTTLMRRRPEPHKIAPCFQIALDLGDVDSLYYKSGNGRWHSVAVPADRTFLNTIIKDDSLASNELYVASSKTSKGVKLSVPGVERIDRVYISAGIHGCPVKIIVAMREETLPPNHKVKSLVYDMRVEKCKDIDDLPKASEVEKHSADIVEIDDFMMTLGNPGWGDFVDDEKATDGYSVKLYTYPTWCLTWQVDPALFTPGRKYVLKMLARVEKAEPSGEAFYAGVYDAKDRKDIAYIAKDVSSVQDGYQWYTVGEFVPGGDQKVWISPGRYDHKTGNTSAVKNVYIDKLIFEKIQSE